MQTDFRNLTGHISLLTKRVLPSPTQRGQMMMNFHQHPHGADGSVLSIAGVWPPVLESFLAWPAHAPGHALIESANGRTCLHRGHPIKQKKKKKKIPAITNKLRTRVVVVKIALMPHIVCFHQGTTKTENFNLPTKLEQCTTIFHFSYASYAEVMRLPSRDLTASAADFTRWTDDCRSAGSPNEFCFSWDRRVRSSCLSTSAPCNRLVKSSTQRWRPSITSCRFIWKKEKKIFQFPEELINLFFCHTGLNVFTFAISLLSGPEVAFHLHRTKNSIN